jgi:hypothetical protein
MNTQFSPTPWKTEVLGDTIRVIDAAGNDILIVGSVRESKNVAEARLIAAAPDLLAALERALDYIAKDGVPEDGEDVYEQGEQARPEIRVSKATPA